MSRHGAHAIDVLRRAGAHPALLPTTALALRARTVRPASAFFVRERLHRGGAFAYRLAEAGISVTIRHGSGDVVTLGEIFHDRQYAPVPEVRPLLREPRRIVDLGANVGLFGAFAASRWPHAEILAFEPDPANAAVHERTILINGLQRRWTLRRAAAAARDGRASFVAGQVALSHLAPSGAGEGTVEVATSDVLPLLADADLVKMDIEGGEWAILTDPRFRAAPPRVLVLEYHPLQCPEPDPRGAVEAALRAAELQLRITWSRGDGHGMLWAWRS